MKKWLCFVLLALVLATPLVFSQAYWGAKLGINGGTFVGDDADAADWGAEEKGARGGFVGGFFFDFRLSDIVGIRPELLASGKGATYEGTDWDIKLKVNTIELPILVQFFLPIPTDAVDVALFVGPAPAYIYSGKYEYSEPGYTEEGDFEDVGADIIDFDLGVVGGLGLSVGAGPGIFLFDVRYTAGVINISDVSNVEFRTSTFGVSVGYGLPF